MEKPQLVCISLIASPSWLYGMTFAFITASRLCESLHTSSHSNTFPFLKPHLSWFLCVLLFHCHNGMSGQKVLCQTILVFGTIHSPICLEKWPWPSWREAAPKYNASSTELHCQYAVSWMMLSIWLCTRHTFENEGQEVQPLSHQTMTHFPTWFGMSEWIFWHNSEWLLCSIW